MKPQQAIVLVIVFVVASLGVTWGGVALAGKYWLAPASLAQAFGCASGHPNHLVVIKNDTVTPAQTHAPRCDRLTIENQDKAIRLMAFGPHEHHTPYDGITEKVLGPGQSFTVTLITAGTVHFHDHLHDQVKGDFTVSP